MRGFAAGVDHKRVTLNYAVGMKQTMTMAMLWIVLGTLAVGVLAWQWLRWRWRQCRKQVFRRRPGKLVVDGVVSACMRRKPEWVLRIVIGLGVHGLTCRQIAANFNRRFGCWITIGKSWVAKVLKAHELEIADRRRAMRAGRRWPLPSITLGLWI